MDASKQSFTENLPFVLYRVSFVIEHNKHIYLFSIY